MKVIKKIFFATAVWSLLIVCTADAGNHTIAATVEINAAAINRYLNAQYIAAGIPPSVALTYNGTTYSLALTLPHVILSPGIAKLQMIFDVKIY